MMLDHGANATPLPTHSEHYCGCVFLFSHVPRDDIAFLSGSIITGNVPLGGGVVRTKGPKHGVELVVVTPHDFLQALTMISFKHAVVKNSS